MDDFEKTNHDVRDYDDDDDDDHDDVDDDEQQIVALIRNYITGSAPARINSELMCWLC